LRPLSTGRIFRVIARCLARAVITAGDVERRLGSIPPKESEHIVYDRDGL